MLYRLSPAFPLLSEEYDAGIIYFTTGKISAPLQNAFMLLIRGIGHLPTRGLLMILFRRYGIAAD